MYKTEQLVKALRNADAAGDVEAATRITQMIQSQLATEKQTVEANRNKGTAGDLLTSLKQGAAEIPAGLAGLADVPVGLLTGKNYVTEAGKKLADVTGIHPSDYAKSLEAEKSVGYQKAQEEANALWQAHDAGKASYGDIAAFYAKHPALTATNVAESAPSMLLGGAYGRALKGVGALGAVARGAIGEGAVSAGQINEQLGEEGGGSRLKSLAALGAGAGTTLIGGASGKLARRLGVVDPETLLAGETKNFTAPELAAFEKAAQRGIASRFGIGALQEGLLQELPQSVQEQMFQNWGGGKPIMEGVARQAVEGALSGSVLGGGFNALGGKDAARQIEEKKAADAAAVQAQAAQLQRQATGTMEQQPLFDQTQAPEPQGPMPSPIAASPIPEPTTTIPEVAPPVQGEMFTPRGKPSAEALQGVEAARVQGLPAQIQELSQTPEGRAQLAGDMKTYFPDLSTKERNKARQAIQQGTYGVEPAVAPEGTLTPEVLKSYEIHRGKAYDALVNQPVSNPMAWKYLETLAGTNTNVGVNANKILTDFAHHNPTPSQSDMFGVPNVPQAQAEEPQQQDLSSVPENRAAPIEPRVEPSMAQPIQQPEAEAPQTAEPVEQGMGLPSGPVSGGDEPIAGRAVQQPSPLAAEAAAELKKEPVATAWGYMSDTPFAKLSKIAKDKVKDAHAQGYLNQELADEIDRIEAGNNRAVAGNKLNKPETLLAEAPTQVPTAPATAPKAATKKEPTKYIQPPKNMTPQEELDYVQRYVDGKDIHEVANFIVQTAPNKSYRIIARLVGDMLKRLENAGMKFDFTVDHTPAGIEGTSSGARGETRNRFGLNDNFMRVRVNGTDTNYSNYAGTNYTTILHELIHAATMSAVRVGNYKAAANTKLGRDVVALYATSNHIIKHFNKRVADAEAGKITLSEIEQGYLARRNNALLDPDEIIAWALTDSRMQAYLESIPALNNTSLWSELVTKIRTLLGIPAVANTAFSEILSHSENMLSAEINVMQDLAAGAKKSLSQEQKTQTESPEFKKWFGSSQIVNDDGTPKVMYHGTPYTWSDAAFKANKLGLIFVTPDTYFANSFARAMGHEDVELLATSGNTPTMIPVFASAETPFNGNKYNQRIALYEQLKENGIMEGDMDTGVIRVGGNRDFMAKDFDKYAQDIPFSHIIDPDWTTLERPEIIKALKQAGFDSMYVNEGGVMNLALFSPNQLKSAVGNKGTFNPEDERITHHIDPAAQAQAQAYINGMSGTLAQSVPTQNTTTTQVLANISTTMVSNPSGAFGMIEDMANKFRTKVIDKAAHLSAAIQDANAGAFYNMNGKIRADLLLSAANNINNFVNAVFTRGGMEILANGSIRAKDAKHSVDGVFRHAQTLGQRIGVKEARALITNAFYHYRAKSIIDNVPRNQWPENWLKDPRMIPTQAQINASMAAFNQFPELRAMQTEFIGAKNEMVKFLEQAGFLSPEKARAFLADDSYAPWLRLKDYQDQIPGLGNAGKMVDLRQMKALVGGTEEVNDMLENMAQMIGWCVRSGVSNHTANSALNVMTTMGTATRYTMRPTSGNPAHVVMTYEAGKPVFWTVDNPYDLAAFQTVKGIDSAVMRSMGKWLGRLRAGIVLFPAFPLRQVVMDSQRAFVEAGVDKPWPMMGKIFKSFLSGEAFRGTDADIQELINQGVVGGADFTMHDTTRGRAGQFGMGEAPKTISDKFVASKGYNFLHKLAYSADLAVRLGIYRQTLEETGDKTLAATRAREIINFQKAGTSAFMHTLKQTIPFMGAYLQGMDVNYKAMVGRGNSMKQRKAAAAAYWGNMAMYAGLVILYTMSRSGDDDYEDQKGFITDRNFVIPGGGLIPVPTDVGFLAKVIPERITDYILQHGTDNPESATRFRQGILEASAAGFLPPAAVYGVLPAIEIATNHSFFSNMPIVSQRMQGLEPFLQFTSSTSEFAKDVGDVTNTSPMKIDYIFNAIGGTTAGALLQLSDVMMGSDKIASDKTPVISSFQQKSVGGRYAEEYYAVRELTERAYLTAKAMQDSGNQAKLDEYLSDPRMQARIDRRDAVEAIHQQLIDAQQQRAAIETDTALSPSMRRAEVNRINAEIEQGLRDAGIRQVRKELE